MKVGDEVQLFDLVRRLKNHPQARSAANMLILYAGQFGQQYKGFMFAMTAKGFLEKIQRTNGDPVEGQQPSPEDLLTAEHLQFLEEIRLWLIADIQKRGDEAVFEYQIMSLNLGITPDKSQAGIRAFVLQTL